MTNQQISEILTTLNSEPSETGARLMALEGDAARIIEVIRRMGISDDLESALRAVQAERSELQAKMSAAAVSKNIERIESRRSSLRSSR